MKVLQILGVCAAVLFSVACSSDDVVDATANEFKVVSVIAPVSRAPQLGEDGSGKFQSGDVNSLFFHTAEKGKISTLDYTYGKQYYWYDLQIPQEVTTCKLTGCYPKVSTDDPENYNWDIRTASPTTDFLVSAPVDINVNSSSAISLIFAHALHKLAVVLEAGESGLSEDVLAQTQISCRNFKPVATLDLLDGKAISASGDLHELSVTGKKAEFIIPAQEVGTMEVVVNLNGKSKSFKLSDCQLNSSALKQLESGKIFTLRLKVTKEGFVISGQSISGWGNQGEVEDTIII